MLFVSFEFIIFLLIVFSLYYIPIPGKYGRKAYQVTLLLLASAIFYGWDNMSLLILLFISCIGNTICCITILKNKINGHDSKIKTWVAYAVVLNLLLLGVFKYSGFIAGIIPGLPESWMQWLKSIPLPIGISFYTFHGISMIIDVAKGHVQTSEATELKPEEGKLGFVKATRDVGFYMLFFPQLIAGPIVRARQFWPQIEAKKFNDIHWGTALRFLIVGYFLKMVVADNMSEFTPYLKDISLVSTMGAKNLLLLMFGYSFQIFADFGGYSLIAVGLAVLFGYRLPNNFNFPYISTSITEFWQRWNMTLSQWLRDYLYIPLGGNKKGNVRTYLNLFIVMFLGGLWHGAEWKFALWGTSHGLFLAAERLLWNKRKNTSSVMKLLGGIYCFVTVSLLWMTFLMPDMNTLLAFIKGLGDWEPGLMNISTFSVLLYGVPVILYHALGWSDERTPALSAKLRRPWIEGCVLGCLVFLTINNPGPTKGFIYFQF